MFIRLLVLSISTFFATVVCGQSTDHLSSVTAIDKPAYFRIHYDNDYFTKTDYYYTQGLSFELVTPGLRRNPLNKLLIAPRNAELRYGLSLNVWGQTPVDTDSEELVSGDRPFASSASLNSFVIGVDTIKRQHISSMLSLGMIGPATLGEEIHKEIHRLLDNKQPRGWQHQIKNDVIINYTLSYEKNLLNYSGLMTTNAVGKLNAGTYRTNAALGINSKLGKYNDAYKTTSAKKYEFYAYGQALANVIGYDAGLQGGVFNNKSPYTIPSGDINRFTIRADAGIVLRVNRFCISHYYSFLTREFKSGRGHKWGGIRLGIIFK